MNEFLKDINLTITSAMEKMNVPGAQIAVVKDGAVIYKEAFGYADVENKVEMTVEHLLPIGSITKTFTATAAVKLVSEGKLKLDTPVKEYISGFELSDPVATVQATVRDLMCHRTGLPRHDFMWADWDTLSREDLVLNRIKHLKVSLPLRANFQYSNHMYATMGYLIEKTSGITWELYIRKFFLKPLSINRYSFSIPYPYETTIYSKLYTPNKLGENVENIPLRIGAMGPAGSLNMSATQLIKWVNFQINGGKVGDVVLISPGLFSELFRHNIPVQALNLPGRIHLGYGLGWFLEVFRGKKVAEHGGNVAGGSAIVSFMPEENLGIVVLTNADSNLFTNALTKFIYDRYLETEPIHDWFEEYKKITDEDLKILYNQKNLIYNSKIQGKNYSHDLKEYEGIYTNKGYGEIQLKVRAGELKLSYHGNKLEIQHLHYDIFTTELYDRVFPISFVTGFDGKIISLSIPFEDTVEPIIFIKVKG